MSIRLRESVGSRIKGASTFFICFIGKDRTEMTATESQLETPPASRLVIRVKLVSSQEPPPPAPPRLSKSCAAGDCGSHRGVAGLGWFQGLRIRSDASADGQQRAAAEAGR